ncbi:MAG: elongation factor G, partial [Oscillospiraceae bacterium]
CVNAKPTLLEPIGKLSAYVPDSNTGDIMGEVNKRRGRVLGMNPAEDCLQLVEAEVPMSEMYDFTTFMRSSTQGRGHFSLEFTKYEPLPQMLEQKVIEDAKELREAEEE